VPRRKRFERLAANRSIASKAAIDRGVRAGLENTVKAIERELIVHALSVCKGNITRAAELLRTSRQQLQRKIRRHKI
jgi:DNA-binding NtrC family response regulator